MSSSTPSDTGLFQNATSGPAHKPRHFKRSPSTEPQSAHASRPNGGFSTKAALLSFVVVCGMLISYPPVSKTDVLSTFGEYAAHPLLLFAGRIMLSLPAKETAMASAPLLLLVYWLARHNVRSRSSCVAKVLAALFAFAMVFGSMLETSSSSLASLITGASQQVKIIYGLVCWFYFGNALFSQVLQHRWAAEARPMPRYAQIIIRFLPVILAIAWLPWLIASFPGMLMGDTPAELLMYFGYPSYVSNSVNLLDPQMLITQHHPVLHVVLLGLAASLGASLFSSINVGIFLFTLAQFACTIATLSLSVRYLLRRGTSYRILLALAAAYTLLPLFPNYAVLLTKDSLFVCCLLAFVISVDSTTRNNAGAKQWLALLASGLLVSLLRSGAFVVVIFTLFVAAIYAIRSQGMQAARPAMLVLAGTLAVNIALTSVIYPALSITPASPREMLSIPIQQVAAVAAHHPESISESEYEAIDAVIDLNKVAERYNPSNADPIKNTWNKNATGEDRSGFISAWLSVLAKEPLTCIEATFRNYYGFLYPSEQQIGQMTIAWSDSRASQLSPITDYQPHIKSDIQRFFADLVSGYQLSFERIPVLSLLSVSAFWVWMLLICCAKAWVSQKRVLIIVTPLVLVTLIALIGPCNATTYFRYVYPLMFTLPTVFALLLENTPTTSLPQR